MKTHLAFVGVLVWIAIVVVSCGIPEDSEPRALPEATPTPTVEAPTPTPVVTQEFTIYLADSQGVLRPATRQLPDRLTVSALIEELKEVPTEEETEAGLVSVIPPETTLLEVPTTDDAGLTILNLAAGSFDSLQGETRLLALGQLVWTLTQSPEVRSVLIRVEDEAERWPTPNGDFSILQRSDYESLGPDFIPPTPEPSPEAPVEEEPTPGPTPTPEGADTDGGDDTADDG